MTDGRKQDSGIWATLALSDRSCLLILINFLFTVLAYQGRFIFIIAIIFSVRLHSILLFISGGRWMDPRSSRLWYLPEAIGSQSDLVTFWWPVGVPEAGQEVTRSLFVHRLLSVQPNMARRYL